MGKLYAIADLHLGYKFNTDALAALRDTHRDDGLILAGDLGERDEHLRLAFAWATERFKTVWWCPGNHELYSMPDYSSSSTSEDGGGEKKEPLRGQAKYDACVAVAREYGVLTPEDPFVTWEGEGGGDPAIVCPVFTLYDYSFAPEDVPKGKEVDWAAEKDICATDEALLHPDPYPTRQAWCEALVERFERKLEDTVTAAAAAAAAAAVANNRDEKTKITTEESSGTGTSEKEEEEATATETTTKPKPKLIIVNHWPLIERLVYLPAIPRFRIWCGTRRTADWAARFGAAVVVSGHLHIRRTDWVGGVRYEECSLGYPRQWERARNAGRDINAFLREILPGPKVQGEEGKTKWWIYGDA